MGRKSPYLVIVRTRVEETLAIARIVRSRARRRLAEAELAQARRRTLLRRAVLERQRQIIRILGRVGIGKTR